MARASDETRHGTVQARFSLHITVFESQNVLVRARYYGHTIHA
jgi:hypothetical protein